METQEKTFHTKLDELSANSQQVMKEVLERDAEKDELMKTVKQRDAEYDEVKNLLKTKDREFDTEVTKLAEKLEKKCADSERER